jgi:hypothetical protein
MLTKSENIKRISLIGYRAYKYAKEVNDLFSPNSRAMRPKNWRCKVITNMINTFMAATTHFCS